MSPTAVHPSPLEKQALTALGTVLDPELDEPITDLGFVRSVATGAEGDLVVHLRLPTSFCSPSFAYLMASDAYDALGALPGVRSVVVQLDDHHDSDRINRGLAADAGYVGTFGAEADESLDELRDTFRRKAHTAAMERALTSLLRSDPGLTADDLAEVRLVDLPDVGTTHALLRRRAAIGLSTDPTALVLVDEAGRAYPRDEVPLRLRRARTVRISIDGNAHFCRGLLRTRYPDSAPEQAPCAHGDTDPDPWVRTTSHPLLPLEVKAP